MDLSLNFGQAGGVTAESIGVDAPDCGPDAYPMIGPDGYWQCVKREGTGGDWGKVLIGAALAYVLWKVYSDRWGKRLDRVKSGDMGALL